MAIETTRDLCLSVADAIREKKGSSDLINPQDFAKEIASIEGGGNGGSGESASTIEYVSVEGKDVFEWGEVFGIAAFLVKMPTEIIPLSLRLSMGETVDGAIAFAIDPTLVADFFGTRMTIADFLASGGVDLSTYNHLTKEQFYDLNA